MSADIPLREAGWVLARALCAEDPVPEEIARFEEAVRLRAPELASARDRALWRVLVRGPRRARLVDAGLAFTDPHSPVRLRVCLMLAILEASPVHVRRFLHETWSVWTPWRLAGRVLRAAFRTAAGWALVASHGRLWR